MPMHKYTIEGRYTALALIRRNENGSFLRIDGGKQVSFLENWKDATVKTKEQIAQHFKKWDAALGMLTGEKNGITVIDFDTKDNELFLALYSECPTFCVETEKGFHLYYQYSNDPMFVNRAGVFRGGVDVRNDGGLIFCPPTPNYRVYGDEEIQTLTAAGIALLRESFTPSGGKAQGKLSETETRNDSLFRYGCKWINEYTKEDTWVRMVRANNAFTKGKLADKELETIYQQVLKYAPGGKDDSLDVAIQGIPFLRRETKDGGESVSKCMTNAYWLLKEHASFKGRFRFDSFANEEQVKDGDAWVRLSDSLTARIHKKVQSIHPAFHGYGKELIDEAIGLVCSENTIDSAQDWIRSLEWDGTPRLDAFVGLAFGVSDSRYHALVGRFFFLGMAARILKPGCHHRSVLILQGPQNSGKSLALRAIAGDEWILEDAPLTIESLSFQMSLWGKLIVEFSEGTILNRADASKLKGLISNPVDTVVKKWGKHPTDVPRRCVFTMTTNKEHFLLDETGNTRFFPVATKKIDIAWIKENRSQLFAEARVLIEKGEKWWSESEEDAKLFCVEQNRRLVENPMEEKVVEWVSSEMNRLKRVTGFRLFEILDGVFGSKKVSKSDEMMVGRVLTELGYTKTKRMVGGIRSAFWTLED